MLQRHSTARQDASAVRDAQRRASQCARVYAELRRWYPHECPLWALHDLKPRISDLTTRIWELRHKYELVIENHTERAQGQVCSFYLLTRDSEEAARTFEHPNVLPALISPRNCAIATRPIQNPLPEHGSGSLFGDLSHSPEYPH